MARRVKKEEGKDSVFRMKGDDVGIWNTSKNSEISVVGRGKGKYLWVGDGTKFIGAFSGPKILRSFAKEILKGL